MSAYNIAVVYLHNIIVAERGPTWVFDRVEEKRYDQERF